MASEAEKKEAREEAIKEAKAQARRGEPRDEAAVEEKLPADERREQRKQEQEAAHSRDRLVAEAQQVFGKPPYVVAGALSGEKKQNFTVAEVEEKIDEFLSREVETEDS